MTSTPRNRGSGKPIPGYAGEMLHIDIFLIDRNLFLICVDKFSKFAIVQPVTSRTIVDIMSLLLQIVNMFPNFTTVYCDNKPTFNSGTITSLLKNNYCIDVVNEPTLHSSSKAK